MVHNIIRTLDTPTKAHKLFSSTKCEVNIMYLNTNKNHDFGIKTKIAQNSNFNGLLTNIRQLIE